MARDIGALVGQLERREARILREAVSLVAALPWSEVLDICGTELRGLQAEAARSFRELFSSELPNRVLTGPVGLEAATDGSLLLCSHSTFDGLRVDAQILGILSQCASEQSVSALEREGVTRETLRVLLDWGALVSTSGDSNGE